MHTAVLKIESDFLKDQKEISVVFSFNESNSADDDKKDINLNSSNYLAGDMEKNE